MITTCWIFETGGGTVNVALPLPQPFRLTRNAAAPSSRIEMDNQAKRFMVGTPFAKRRAAFLILIHKPSRRILHSPVAELFDGQQSGIYRFGQARLLKTLIGGP